MKKFLRKLLSEAGFSMAEMSISAAISGVVILGVTSMLDTQNQGRTQVSQIQQIAQWSGLITRVLKNPNSCRATLTAALLDLDSVPVDVNHRLRFSGQNTTNVGVGVESSGVLFQSFQATTSSQMLRTEGSYNIWAVNLQAIFSKVDSGRTVRRSYNVMVKADSSNVVVDCYGKDSIDNIKEKACEAIGGTFSPKDYNCLIQTVAGDQRSVADKVQELQDLVDRVRDLNEAKKAILCDVETDLCENPPAGGYDPDLCPSPHCLTLGFGSSHSTGECVGIGGVVTDIGGGAVCRVSGSVCPGGWSQYLNWSDTYHATPYECHAGTAPCDPMPAPAYMSGHSWSNAPQENSGALTIETFGSDPSCPPDGKGGFTDCCYDSGSTTSCNIPVLEVGCI